MREKNLSHLFPHLPAQPGCYKRRRRLADTIEWLQGVFAERSPGYYDDLLLIDSTPVECARSRETVGRSQLSDAADYGYCASHSRYFWGFRLHAIFASDGTPRAFCLASPKLDEREVGLERHGARTLDGLRERILQRFLCPAACVCLNHQLGRRSRALVDYCA